MSAYAYRDTLADLGIDIPALGCVMLDVEPIDGLDRLIAPHDLYESTDPAKHWIRGLVAADGAHLTLLYGLLQSAQTWREHVDSVLDGWEPGPVRIESWGMFESTFEDEPYACIIGHVERTPAIVDAHSRLSYLPHIDTHPEYKPHVTVAYVRRDAAQRVLAALESVATPTLRPVGLNYGDHA